jgi:hypothetical protein
MQPIGVTNTVPKGSGSKRYQPGTAALSQSSTTDLSAGGKSVPFARGVPVAWASCSSLELPIREFMGGAAWRDGIRPGRVDAVPATHGVHDNGWPSEGSTTVVGGGGGTEDKRGAVGSLLGAAFEIGRGMAGPTVSLF